MYVEYFCFFAHLFSSHARITVFHFSIEFRLVMVWAYTATCVYIPVHDALWSSN